MASLGTGGKKESTEWDDILKSKGIIPEKSEEELAQEALTKVVEETIERFDPHENKDVDELDEDLEEADSDEERILEQYRERRIMQMKAEALIPRFGPGVRFVPAVDWKREVTEAGESIFVVVHLFQQGIEGCKLMDARLLGLSEKFPHTKFVKCKASDAIKNYPDSRCPTLLVYNAGKVLKQFVGLNAFAGTKTSEADVEWALSTTGAVKTDMAKLKTAAGRASHKVKLRAATRCKNTIKSSCAKQDPILMSVTGKVFVRRNRRGNVQLIAREHYLRDDLACGAAQCPSCPKESFGAATGRVGPTEKVYIPDADAVLRQIDIFEKGGSVLSNILFLQSVLRTIRGRSSEVYDRVRELLVSPPDDLRTAIFSNEHRRETYLERTLAGEAEDKYNARLLTHAVQWLNAHWKSHGTTAVLLVDNARSVYPIEDVPIVTVKSVVENKAALLEIYAEYEEDEAMDVDEGPAATKRPRFLFPDYLPERKARAGVKAGRYFQGTFRPSMYNVQEACASVAMDPKDRSKMTKVLLIGREKQNRAIDGDIVIIEILPKSEWRGTSNLAVTQDDLQEESDDDDTAADDVIPKKGQRTAEEIVPNGKVIAIAKRNWRPYCGTISGESFRGGESALFVPIDRSVPKIRIRSRRIKEHLGKRLIVVVDKWSRSSAHPGGHIVREVGASGDKEAETEVILIENGIPTRKFSKAAMACLPDENWVVTEEHVKTRWDFRDMDICSVDPPGCTDIDDALHFRRINDSEIEVGVHIADVTAFVAHDSPLDKEAAERGCTVYLVDRRIEMLPSLLSSKLCSLRSNVERLAFSAIMTLDNDGNVLSSKYGRSVINSKASLTYQQAQERIDAARKVLGGDESSIDNVTRSLLGLAGVAKKLRKRRMAAGALILASPEVKFKISEVTDEITDVHLYKVRETNRMVEEFMLLANVVVAEKTLRQFPQCAMLRRHPRPSEEMFEPLLRAAKAAGFEIDVSNSRKLNDSLSKLDAEAKANGDDYLGTLLRIIATRSMTQAVYFSSGEVSDPEYLHYGLASPVYTHFTSPIRRYADVLVHRLLSACLGFSSLPMSLQNSKRMNQLADVINQRHRCAQFASRASSVLHTVLLFKNKTLREPARITKLLGNGFVVLVPKYGVEGIVHIDDELKPVVDEDMQKMKLANGQEYKVLGTVRVQIRVDSKPERQDRVIYEIAEDEMEQ